MKPRKPLSQKMKTVVAEQLHLEFLRLFMLKTRYTVDDLVFHGGTSLKILHGSPRFSEDLDFMISARIQPAILSDCAKVARAVNTAMKAAMPGIRVSWRPKEPKGRMTSGFLIAEHPEWIGNTKVKIECYTAVDLSSYLATNMLLASGTIVPTGTLESILGDKIVAVAMRPYFKERDLFDLWWLRQRGAGLDPARIKSSAAVYGYTLEQIRAGLERLEERVPDEAEIEASLSRWLPGPIVEQFSTARLFRDLRDTVFETRDDVLQMLPETDPS